MKKNELVHNHDTVSATPIAKDIPTVAVANFIDGRGATGVDV